MAFLAQELIWPCRSFSSPFSGLKINTRVRLLDLRVLLKKNYNNTSTNDNDDDVTFVCLSTMAFFFNL